jgi:hypothetical protein
LPHFLAIKKQLRHLGKRKPLIYKRFIFEDFPFTGYSILRYAGVLAVLFHLCWLRGQT